MASFDVVVGMDWLEIFSPMKVHWQEKWISIPYQGNPTVLIADPAYLDHQLHLQIHVEPNTDTQVAHAEVVPTPIQ